MGEILLLDDLLQVTLHRLIIYTDPSHTPHITVFCLFYLIPLSVLPLCGSSRPVWLHHSVRGLLPLGSALGSVQQHPGDQGGRLEVHHPVQTAGGVQGSEHRSVAGDPQRGGHFIRRYQCESVNVVLFSGIFTNIDILMDDKCLAFELERELNKAT